LFPGIYFWRHPLIVKNLEKIASPIAEIAFQKNLYISGFTIHFFVQNAKSQNSPIEQAIHPVISPQNAGKCRIRAFYKPVKMWIFSPWKPKKTAFMS